MNEFEGLSSTPIEPAKDLPAVCVREGRHPFVLAVRLAGKGVEPRNGGNSSIVNFCPGLYSGKPNPHPGEGARTAGGRVYVDVRNFAVGVIQGRVHGGEEPSGVILSDIMRDHVNDTAVMQNSYAAPRIAGVDGQNDHEQFYRRSGRDAAHPGIFIEECGTNAIQAT